MITKKFSIVTYIARPWQLTSINEDFLKKNLPGINGKYRFNKSEKSLNVPCSLFRILNNMIMCYHNHEVNNFFTLLP